MQVPWLHIEMKKPAKYGWLFSLFAGIFAISSINVLGSLISVPGEPPPVLILYFGACAFLAARVAGWIARALGSEDYGWAAGAITAPLFLSIYGFPTAVDQALYGHRNWPELILASFGSFLFFLLFVLPFCLLGTAVFIGGLHLWSYSRRSDA